MSIFATECLPSGVTQIYCKTSDGADELRQRYRNHLVSIAECQAANDGSPVDPDHPASWQ